MFDGPIEDFMRVGQYINIDEKVVEIREAGHHAEYKTVRSGVTYWDAEMKVKIEDYKYEIYVSFRSGTGTMVEDIDIILEDENMNMRDFLSNDNYMYLSLRDRKFVSYIRQYYFSNDRKEQLQALSSVHKTKLGRKKIIWVRIKDTEINRDYLFAALQEYYRQNLERREFKNRVKKARKTIKQLLRDKID